MGNCCYNKKKHITQIEDMIIKIDSPKFINSPKAYVKKLKCKSCKNCKQPYYKFSPQLYCSKECKLIDTNMI